MRAHTAQDVSIYSMQKEHLTSSRYHGPDGLAHFGQRFRPYRVVGAPRDVFAPELAPGDLLVYDQRTVHRGVANVSPNSRPILYLLFCRPWFREHINFGSTSLFDDDDEPPRPKKKHRS